MSTWDIVVLPCYPNIKHFIWYIYGILIKLGFKNMRSRKMKMASCYFVLCLYFILTFGRYTCAHIHMHIYIYIYIIYIANFINGRLMRNHVLLNHAVIGFVIALDLLQVYNRNTQGYHQRELRCRKIAMEPTVHYVGGGWHFQKWNACWCFCMYLGYKT